MTHALITTVLNRNSNAAIISDVVNRMVTEHNREDQQIPIYGTDTGSGTAYAMAPIPGIRQYGLGQIFEFKAVNANTSTTPTLNVNGKGAGTITYSDGSALVPGDIAAGGSYFVQVASLTAALVPTFQLLTARGNRLLQVVSTETGAVNTGATTTPFDDTIPQITEGNEFLTLAITPKSSASKLIIHVIINVSHSIANVGLIAALHQDSTANALAVTMSVAVVATVPIVIPLRHVMTSGTISSTTFRVRIGSPTAGTVTFNGQSGGRIFGGAYASGIVIEEVLP